MNDNKWPLPNIFTCAGASLVRLDNTWIPSLSSDGVEELFSGSFGILNKNRLHNRQTLLLQNLHCLILVESGLQKIKLYEAKKIFSSHLCFLYSRECERNSKFVKIVLQFSALTNLTNGHDQYHVRLHSLLLHNTCELVLEMI